MILYGYKKCSTVSKARKYLDEQKISYDYVDLVEDGISQTKMAEIVKKVGDIDLILNRRSITYRNEKIKDKWDKLDKKGKIKLLVTTPKVIKRPILVSGDQVVIGFSEEEYQALKKTKAKK